MKYLLGIFLTIFLFSSCGNTYQVADLLKLPPRDLEALETVSVTGKMGGSINIGILNAFALEDLNDSDSKIYISSKHVTLPGKKGEKLTLQVKLVEEIDFAFSKFYLFEEKDTSR